MIGLFKINEDSAFGPGMMFGIGGPGPKRDTKGIPSDKSKEKGVKVKDMKKLKAIPTFEKFISEAVVNQQIYKYPSTDVGSIVEVEGKKARVVEILAYTKNNEANIIAFTAEIDGDIVRVKYNDAKDGYEIYTTED